MGVVDNPVLRESIIMKIHLPHPITLHVIMELLHQGLLVKLIIPVGVFESQGLRPFNGKQRVFDSIFGIHLGVQHHSFLLLCVPLVPELIAEESCLEGDVLVILPVNVLVFLLLGHCIVRGLLS